MTVTRCDKVCLVCLGLGPASNDVISSSLQKDVSEIC